MLISNYHTHSRWCNHAVGEYSDYIEKAISLGFQEIALTDHVPHEDTNYWSWMPYEDFPAFNKLLDETIAKYKDQIKIFKGFECEHILSEVDFYKRLQEDYGYEFLIQGQHIAGTQGEVNAFNCYEEDEVKVYAEWVCKGIESGLYKFLAHPDVIYSSYRGPWNQVTENAFRQIFSCCEEHNMPLEINASGLRGMRGYPKKEVFQLSKEYHLKYLINTDAHDPDWLYDDIAIKAEQFAADLGLAVMPLYRP